MDYLDGFKSAAVNVRRDGKFPAVMRALGSMNVLTGRGYFRPDLLGRAADWHRGYIDGVLTGFGL